MVYVQVEEDLNGARGGGGDASGRAIEKARGEETPRLTNEEEEKEEEKEHENKEKKRSES